MDSIDFNYYYFFPDMLGISQLKSKPKTITDMMNNDKILREFNTNHQDNLFKKKTTNKKLRKVNTKQQLPPSVPNYLIRTPKKLNAYKKKVLV